MFGFKFAKFEPNNYVLMYQNGKIVREGAGLACFYFAPVTSLVMISSGSVEVPFIFEELTADFQTITLQGQVTYRIENPKKIAELLNFTLDGSGRRYVSEDPQRLPQRIINIVKVLIKKRIEGLSLTDALKSSEKLADSISGDITVNTEFISLGIEILGLSILAILPNKETARALEAQTRETILRKADDAVYERRNAAIEQERVIKENELDTDIAVENKKLQIRETQMEAERVIRQKENELSEAQMRFETALEEQRKELIRLSVENSKAEADAKAYELTAMMRALDGMDAGIIQSLANMGMQPDKLIAMAFQGLAGKAERIGQLNITPDLLQNLINRDE
jgi:SPFH domain / Band 7 family